MTRQHTVALYQPPCEKTLFGLLQQFDLKFLMSPCSTSACLLVLLGAVLAASGFPRHRRAQHVSEKMTQKQALIAHELVSLPVESRKARF